MFKVMTIDFRALTAITLFLLAEWQIKKPFPQNTKAFPMQSSLPK